MPPRPAMAGHPSTAARRRFGAADGGAKPDTPPAHGRGFGPEAAEEPPSRRGGRRPATRTEQRYTQVRERQRERQMKSEIRGEQFRPVEAAARPFRSTSRLMIAEFLAALVIVALKPSEPATFGEPGTQPASKSVVPQLFGITGTFFLLGLVAASGPRAQKFANAFGGLIVLGLLLLNHGAVVSSITGVTSYQLPGTPAGAPSATSETPPAIPGTAPPISPAGAQAATAQYFQDLTGGVQQVIPGVSSPAALQQQLTNMTGWRGVLPSVATPSGNAAGTGRPSGVQSRF